MKFSECSDAQFFDPATFLCATEEMLRNVLPENGAHAAAALRTRAGREVEEDRRCAILCYGLAVASGAAFHFCNLERSDYDYVLAVQRDNISGLIPLQMKQLVPSSVNLRTSLQSEIDKLKRKYPTSSDLCVAIHINRLVRVAPKELDLAGLKIGELWLFGVEDHSERRWRIIGNLMNEHCGSFTYTLPAA
ncbi:hypothetical protein [Rhodanobacter lindaniclasticus]|uniref:Uncharacterized protein n=1 Tax=Rhodanobacter lindaniclasticus TaxID=75310 RepID=A0A4S3KCJ1_9GAMM|nr:hypothetical protein [Rhodanobacter lindaniclasticus]THD05928.1 hypothetical protein B1991_15370 [Rhodanobacter lindaniclasticus]